MTARPHGEIGYSSSRMPSELTTEVRSALEAFVKSRTSDGAYIPADVLRCIRNEASNQLELQQIFDALDSDPYKICDADSDDGDAVRRQLTRFKRLLRVESCIRTTTREGRVDIHAVVNIGRDTKTSIEVKDMVRLEFTYSRCPIDYDSVGLGTQNQDGDSNDHSGEREFAKVCTDEASALTDVLETHKGTQVTYSIYYSRDHGRKLRVMTIEVLASGEAPSDHEAIPMEDSEDEWDEFDENGDPLDKKHNMEQDGNSKVVTMGTAQNAPIVADGKDRYSAYIDPDAFMEFFENVGLAFDESTAVFFLLTFPYCEFIIALLKMFDIYLLNRDHTLHFSFSLSLHHTYSLCIVFLLIEIGEHEWDLVGMLLDAIFQDSGGEDEDEDVDEL